MAGSADRGTFCSALVAQVFAAAGAAEFARTPVEKTTPATIERMGSLSDVTNQIFREGPAPRNAETMTALDGDPAPTPSSRQTEISNRYAKAVPPDADRLVARHPGSDLAVTPTYWGMLDLILSAHDAAAALQPREAAALVGGAEAIDRKLAELIASGELATMLGELEAIEGAELSQALAQSATASPGIDVAAMAAQSVTTAKTLDVRRKALAQMRAWNAGRSRAVESYCALEERAIRAIETREEMFRRILARIDG